MLYIENNLSNTDRVQFLWDGRAYYCDQRCIADNAQSVGLLLSKDSPSPEVLAHQLREKGITHILLSRPDAFWFINFHDPAGLHQAALDYFESTFLPACARPIYVEDLTELYILVCQ
jgi:hypothetical protein